MMTQTAHHSLSVPPEPDADLKALRHHLHRHPELSGKEFYTADYLIGYYTKHFQPDEIVRVAGHGIGFVFNGQAPGKTILIRTELDALPIIEVNTFAHKSTSPGVSHKCGHDGHMTMVAGVAKYLSKNRPAKGRVVLLHQPAEETGEGARAVYEDPNFSKIRPDIAFSLHNIPGKPMHQILCKPGSFSRAVKSMIITLKGKTAHASKPETGINPALAAAAIIQAADSINKSASKGSLITLIHTVIGDKAYGVSAGYGEVHFTLRGPTNEALDTIWNDLSAQAKAIAEKNSLLISFGFTEEFMANSNDEEAVEMIRKAAADNKFDYVEMVDSNPWGEDFGMITSHLKGAMFGLGAGESNPDLHNPDYDFPDELIPTGTAMFIDLINRAQS